MGRYHDHKPAVFAALSTSIPYLRHQEQPNSVNFFSNLTLQLRTGLASGGAQARRESQRDTGNHYCGGCGELSQPHSVLCPHHLTRNLGSVISWGSGAGGPPGRGSGAGPPTENGFYAYFRSERSHLEHRFQYI